jgi:ferrous iron transport protein B
VSDTSLGRTPWSERIDRVVLNRVAAPFFLLAAIYLVYELSIVQGNELTRLTWPALVFLRTGIASLLPSPGLLFDPYSRLLGLWVVDSASALLNYIPVFFILFALIAVLEESGYMARIAFILDRVFHGFGLHGQSTLPFILSGVMAGGCAVPGVMATRAIPDRRSRLGTILTAPFMNCQAKLPLYILLINIFFADHRSSALIFIATVTILLALLVARLLTSTVLRSMETAPFVMELPAYHAPTLSGVLSRAKERTWVYIQKVATIVAAAAVLIFALLQLPGLGAERKAGYEQELAGPLAGFESTVKGAAHVALAEERSLVDLLNAFSAYEEAMAGARGSAEVQAVHEKFKARFPRFYAILSPGPDATAAKIHAALKTLADRQRQLRLRIKEETLTRSLLGRFGRVLEPVTRFAGFDWKMNVALLSAFTARENSVATLGVLYQEGADESKSLEERMRSATRARGITSLHALAVILFFALYPPCLATIIAIRAETGSWRWTLFSIVFPLFLGLTVSSLVFSLGRAMSLGGLEMMGLFYVSVLFLALLLGRRGDGALAPPQERLTDLSAESF